jgi:adenine-specific DNA-methyltransferase
MWSELRDRRLDGYKFRRQHPVGPFIADFACLEARLIVEIDGGQHFEPATVNVDAVRSVVLERGGFTVLRFDNRQVLTQRTAVVESIHHWLLSHHPHPSPLPQAGEGAIHKDMP